MCRCGKPAVTPVAPATRSETAPTTAALRYRGAKALLVRGPASGVGYACYPGETVAVFERDVAALMASGAFVRPTRADGAV